MSSIKWVADPTHSEISFKVKHMMMTNVTGTFGQFSVDAETEAEDFSSAKVSFAAQIASINTGNEQRDGHLKSADFFDAEKNPELKFVSTSMTKKDDENYVLNGDLTIGEVTNSVSLDVEFGGINKDPWGNQKAGFSITGKINRKEFGLTWNAALETGGVLVSEDVKLAAEIQLVKIA
ncbi:MAG: YceI family protein [Bacteroidia bacterium]